MFILFCKLIIGHFVADYALQNDFVAKAKNHKAPIPGIPSWQVLIAHAAMHAGAVWFILGDSPMAMLCAAIEFVAHAAIDFGKCNGAYGFNQDQALHTLCKITYALLITFAVL